MTSTTSTRSLTAEERAASEAAAREEIAALGLMRYNNAGELVSYVPSDPTVEDIAKSIRNKIRAKTAAAKAEADAVLRGKLEKIVASVVKSHRRGAVSALKEIHGLKVTNENAENVLAFHEALRAGNTDGRNAIVAKLRTKLAGLKNARKTAKVAKASAKASANVAALHAAGFKFNNAYKMPSASKGFLTDLTSANANAEAKNLARRYFTKLLAEREALLAKKSTKKSAKKAVNINADAARAALQAYMGEGKVEDTNVGRYGRLMALSQGTGLEGRIDPPHYYKVIREAFRQQTRKAKKANSPKPGGMGAGAGAGAGAGGAAGFNE